MIFGVAVAVLVSLFSQGGATERVDIPAGTSSSPGQTGSASGRGGVTGGSGATEAGGAGAGAGLGSGAPGAAQIYVHLVGAVVRPGLYQLRAGSRAIDAIAAAGGFTAEADRTPLNLARLLSDGEQILVPVVGQGVPIASPGGEAAPDAKVNLNTADAAALDTLPGVGPATAKDILDWRKKNGRFSSLEDLLSVGGIGEKTFAQLKDRVSL